MRRSRCLLELVRRERGSLPTLAAPPRPDGRLRLGLAYLWGLAAEGLALAAFAVGRAGRTPPAAGLRLPDGGTKETD